MRRCVIVAIVLAVVPSATSAQGTCLDPAELVRLDREWEQALLNRDAGWLQTHLADDFVWVHNHATTTDTKLDVLKNVHTTLDASQITRSRVQSDVTVRVVGSTGLVTGFTVVDRGPSPMRFSFMRTYVLEDGRCRLLGNHTMVVPGPGDPPGAPSH